jgi:hypothetical protein
MNQPTASALKSALLASCFLVLGGATLWGATTSHLGQTAHEVGLSFTEMHARAHLDNLPVHDIGVDR